MTDSVGTTPQYDVVADKFLAHARDGFANAHQDRPACLRLLGEVRGLHVLDAACGPGLYAEELVAHGAQVTGFDNSPRMIELAKQRVPGDFRVHDLAEPLEWLPDASVDRVLLALAMEYVDDRLSLLREFRRVLRPDGALVLSRLHPTGDWLRNGGSYFDVRVIEEHWTSVPVTMRSWLVPLERTCEELHQAGFLIERLLEPMPQPEGAAIDPAEFERQHREPRGFLVVKAIPDPRPAADLGRR